MSNAEVAIHVFHCGQGDTLLLHLDQRKWVLLDCHLPTPANVAEFLKRLADLRITRLDLLCLSHPDRDHYCGMLEVLEHYTSPPRSIGAFCDGGFAGRLASATEPAVIEGELVGLYRKVVALVRAGKLEYVMAVAGTQLAAKTPVRDDSLIAISPSGSRVHLANIEALLTKAIRSPNELSMVLVLESGEQPRSFRGLLTGDAGGHTLGDALQQYKALRPLETDALRFDFVKIPHHGSWRSHRGSSVCGAIRAPEESVAAVSSASKSPRLPRREVLQAFLASGWRVFDTGRRRSPTDRFVNLLAWTEGEEAKHDVFVSWNAATGLNAGPEEARVKMEHLAFYPSGGASS